MRLQILQEKLNKLADIAFDKPPPPASDEWVFRICPAQWSINSRQSVTLRLFRSSSIPLSLRARALVEGVFHYSRNFGDITGCSGWHSEFRTETLRSKVWCILRILVIYVIYCLWWAFLLSILWNQCVSCIQVYKIIWFPKWNLGHIRIIAFELLTIFFI